MTREPTVTTDRVIVLMSLLQPPDPQMAEGVHLTNVNSICGDGRSSPGGGS